LEDRIFEPIPLEEDDIFELTPDVVDPIPEMVDPDDEPIPDSCLEETPDVTPESIPEPIPDPKLEPTPDAPYDELILESIPEALELPTYDPTPDPPTFDPIPEPLLPTPEAIPDFDDGMLELIPDPISELTELDTSLYVWDTGFCGASTVAVGAD